MLVGCAHTTDCWQLIKIELLMEIMSNSLLGLVDLLSAAEVEKRQQSPLAIDACLFWTGCNKRIFQNLSRSLIQLMRRTSAYVIQQDVMVTLR